MSKNGNRSKETEVLLKTVASQLAKLDDLEKQEQSFARRMEVLRQRAKKLQNPVFTVPGLLATYMNAVKHTEGMTSVVPSCVKALQIAEKSATVESVTSAIKSLEDHKKSVQKGIGSDPIKRRMGSQFIDELDRIAKKLTNLL
jgi:hypothetical protein